MQPDSGLTAWNTGSTPGASKTFQPQRCGLISMTVIVPRKLTMTSQRCPKRRTKTLRDAPKTVLAQSYGLGSRTLSNARPTFEPIITRRRSRRPIFQPKRQKASPTSMKQATLSIPCTICPPSVLKNAPSLSSTTNPVIAPRIMVAPSKRQSIPSTRHSQNLLIIPRGSLPKAASAVPKTRNSY
jgi:hypothetical protein